MQKNYRAQAIEKKWQKVWEHDGHPKSKGEKGKYYILDMFPYPSGDGLHVGHVENYTATDILSRFKRMNGYDVMHPIGWDAFGLPAENFAIKTGIHPDKKTHQNIKNFTRQIKSLGMSYDWDREIDTSSSEYYRWTQWMFLFLYENGLAYKKQAHVNWCPKDATVLANEQVADGKCDRCGTEVIQKDLEQWFFKITDFVEDFQTEAGKTASGLLSGLEKVDWPSSTKAAQRHWIGRSEGTEVIFPIANTEEELKVFTTRVDTIFGCTYVVVAPEHPLARHQAIRNKTEVKKYLEKTAKKTDLERTELNKEKTGVLLEGIEAINPFTSEKVPVYVADYVLGTYGTGAVMAVPAHDERDYEFSKKHDLPIKSVVAPYIELTGDFSPKKNKKTTTRECVTGIILSKNGDKVLVLRRKKDGMHVFPGGGVEEGESPAAAMMREVREETGYTDFEIVRVVAPRLYGHGYKAHKDVNCFDPDTVFEIRLKSEKREAMTEEEHQTHEVFLVEKEMMSDLPRFADHHEYMWKMFRGGEKAFCDDGIVFDSGEFTGLSSAEARKKMSGWLKKEQLGSKRVQYRLRDWLISRQRYWGAPIPIIYCDDCGTVPVPVKDLPVKLPTDVDFRPTGESPLVRSKSFQRVKCPQCGAKARREADTMDTFVCSSWYYLRFSDPKNTKKFADPKKLEKYLPVDFYMGGAEHSVLHLLYARFFTKALAKHGYLGFDEPFIKLRHQGMVLAEDGRKMSKSWGNVVNPDEVVGELGADTLRLYEMFMGPLEDMKAWNTGSVIGLRRFLEKVWKLQDRVVHDGANIVDKRLETLVHKTIKKVTEDIEELKYNTAISALMIFVNTLEKEPVLSEETYRSLVLLLSPFAPHMAEELWQGLGEKRSVFLSKWPAWDPQKIVAETVSVAVQVNGKVRAIIDLSPDESEEEARTRALADEHVRSFIEGKELRKVIYVPGRILNLVV